MKKESERLWTTVQRTERDQMSNCCCGFVLFFSFRNKKKKNRIKNWNCTCGDCLSSTPSLSPLHTADKPHFW